MIDHPSQRFCFLSASSLPVLLALLLGGSLGSTHGQQPPPAGDSQAKEKPPGLEFAPRGERMARAIKYSDWRKFCFKTPGTNMVCRTTISGTFETGQSEIGRASCRERVWR